MKYIHNFYIMSQSIGVLMQKWHELNLRDPGLFGNFEEYCKVMAIGTPTSPLLETVSLKTPIKSVKIGSSVGSSPLVSTSESLETPTKSVVTTSLVTPVVTTDELAQKYRSVFVILTGLCDIKTLAEKCGVVSKALIDVSNLAPLWNLAFDLCDDHMNDICLKFFCENTNDIKSNDTVVKSLSVDVIKHITSSENTSIKEIDLFNFVHHWITLTKPSPDLVGTIIDNIRLPLLQSKELVSIVKPSKLVDKEVYYEALEFSVDPSNDKTEKKFTARLAKLPQSPKSVESVEFYLYPVDKSCPGFRRIETKDITPKFVTEIKKYVEKKSGIAALDDFDTKGYDREIRADDNFLKINSPCAFFIDCHNENYTKNSICPIFADSSKVSTVKDVCVGKKVDDSRPGIAMYVKEGIKF